MNETSLKPELKLHKKARYVRPQPPAGLSRAEKKMYRQIVKQLENDEIHDLVDLGLIEKLVRAYSRQAVLDAKYDDSLGNDSEADEERYERLERLDTKIFKLKEKLGLFPADRDRLQAARPMKSPFFDQKYPGLPPREA